MPEFLIPYLGKIRVEFLFIDSCFSQSPQLLIQSLLNLAEKCWENIEKVQQIEEFFDYLSCLLLLKDYSSCLLVFKELDLRHPMVLFNMALAAIFTQEYKLALTLLNKADLQSPASLLLNVVIHDFLRQEIRALELFAEYQKRFISHSRSSTVLFSSSVSKHLPRRAGLKNAKSDSKLGKAEVFKTTECLKTTEFGTVSTSASHFNLKLKKTKPVRIESKKKANYAKQRTVFKSFPGLNDILLHSSSLPDLPEYSFKLKQFPEFPKFRSPKDEDLASLSKTALLKVISHFTQTRSSLSQVYSIVQKLKFFKQYSKERCFELLEHSTYQFFRHGEVIFKEGDFADKIFVILQGSVSVQQEYKGLSIYVNSRYDGDTIGEYALARGSVEKSFARRSATCTAGESLHTLFITSDDYSEIMNKAADNENVIIHYLKEFRIFQHIQNVDLAYLANCLHVTVYSFEECILPIGQVPKGLYLIVTGRVKAVYKKKVIELPPRYFFGQKVMLGESRPSACQVSSNAVETSIILIDPSLIGLIYKQMRDITMSILALYAKQDL